MQYSKQQILDVVNNQLLLWIKKDEAVKEALFHLVKTNHPTKKETDDKFEKMLNELAHDRIVNEKKWKENRDEDKKKWEEWEKRWAADRDEDKKKWEEWEKRWEENKAENKKQWEETQKVITSMMSEITKMTSEVTRLNEKFVSTLGSIGSRWGRNSEETFRDALQGILRKYTNNVSVSSYVDHDDEGEVFGYPEEIELDIIIKNGVVTIAEIKSSCSISDLYTFYKKALFYERKHQLKNIKKIMVSPMISEKTKSRASKLNIDVYSFVHDVEL